MKNNLKLPFYSLLLFFCTSFLTINNLTAQENDIFEIQQSNENSKISSKKETDRKRFYDLAFNLYPTHYIENNALKSTYDSGDPIKMTFVDAKSLIWLKNKSSKKDAVELITMSLKDRNDFNIKLDLSDNDAFKNLKYVFIICSFNCSEKDIENFVQVRNKVRIFYTIQKPS